MNYGDDVLLKDIVWPKRHGASILREAAHYGWATVGDLRQARLAEFSDTPLGFAWIPNIGRKKASTLDAVLRGDGPDAGFYDQCF